MTENPNSVGDAGRMGMRAVMAASPGQRRWLVLVVLFVAVVLPLAGAAISAVF